MKITTRPGGTGTPVINPGDWFGKAWLIGVQVGNHGAYYIVEADSASDAIDEFLDSEDSGLVRISEEDFENYGCLQSAGDVVNNGVTLTEDTWVDLKGNPRDCKLQECSFGGNYGVPYDGSAITVFGKEGTKCPYECVYFGEDLPPDGLTPLQYSDWGNLSEDVQKYIKELPGGLKHQARKDQVSLVAETWEAAKEVGYDHGWERASSFYEAEVGGNPLRLIKDVATLLFHLETKGQEGLSGLDLSVFENLRKHVNAAKALRDPRCHVVWNWDAVAMRRVPTFTWHTQEGRYESKTLEECPEATRFTFERLLEEPR